MCPLCLHFFFRNCCVKESCLPMRQQCNICPVSVCSSICLIYVVSFITCVFTDLGCAQTAISITHTETCAMILHHKDTVCHHKPSISEIYSSFFISVSLVIHAMQFMLVCSDKGNCLICKVQFSCLHLILFIFCCLVPGLSC